MRLTHLLLALSVVSAPFAAAQTAMPAPPPCDGSYNIVRISDIKPGMYQKFTEAVAAQAAWYKAGGAPDLIVMLRVIDRDAAAGTMKYSETEALTSHISPATPGPRVPHDAAYDAFVALFRASSTIKSEVFTCMPKML
jgi:hypothetical protein